MPLSDSLLAKIDLDLLVERLTACAALWFLQRGCAHPDDILPATGKSAIEMTFDTVARLIEGTIKFEPRSAANINGEVFALLRKTMWRDFLDLVKKGRAHDRTDVMDAAADGEKKSGESRKVKTLDQYSADDGSHFEELNKALVLRRVMPSLDGDKKLEDFVAAVVKHGCIKREDIVAFLKITPQEATNRQRTLRTKLAVWERTINAGNRKTQRIYGRKE